MLKFVWERIYSDLLMPSRLSDYESILKTALQSQYNICSIEQFWKINNENKYCDISNCLILRHDVDTDVPTAKEFFNIEHKLGVSASYYFRLNTIDISFMKTLHNYGSEVSYHYEEISTYAKLYHIKDPQKIYSNILEIQNNFADNLEHLRSITDIPMNIVAAHGDFVNRYLKISNHELLNDTEFRNRLGIYLEVYDTKMMQMVTSRHSDTNYPQYWKPDSPMQAIDTKSKVVYLLTHPRHWRVNIMENIKDDFKRVKEGINYRWCQ